MTCSSQSSGIGDPGDTWTGLRRCHALAGAGENLATRTIPNEAVWASGGASNHLTSTLTRFGGSATIVSKRTQKSMQTMSGYGPS